MIVAAPGEADPFGDTAWLARVLERARPNGMPPALPADLEAAWGVAAAYCGFSAWELAREVANQFGLHCEPLPGEVPEDLASFVHSPWMRRYRAVPIRRGDEHVVVAVANPAAEALVDRVSFLFGVAVVLTVAPPALLRAHYQDIQVAQEPPEEESPEPARRQMTDARGEFHLEDHPGDSAIVALCNVMLRHAIRHGASDIHVQPMGDTGLVRMRLDGLLRNAGRVPLPVLQRLVGRVKAVAGMNPTDRMHPQDAHARAVEAGRTIDLRISTLPVTGGEKLVIRLLGGHQPLTLADLDLTQVELEQLRNLVESSMGLVLVAGPTGSGKTTTLYAVLDAKNTSDVSIVTVEDPVEIRMPRLAQIEVNAKSGLDFASALRSVVRQDPDIILIGEIRDADTAAIAMQAAITGHLVFASIHANDAVSVLPRLGELGVKGDVVGEAVRGVISQRLVRTLCSACAVPAAPPWTLAESWLMQHAGLTSSLRAAGCALCAGTGYKGRRSIMQVLTVTPEVAHLLDHDAPLSEVRAEARRQGMRLLAQSALERIQRGQTSVAEALREMGTDFWRSLAAVAGVPTPGALGLARTTQDDLRGEILLFAMEDEWRATLAGWLRTLGWTRIVEARNEDGVRSAMTRHSDFALVIADVARVRIDRAEVLLAMRSTLAGAVVPILILVGPENAGFAQAVAKLTSTLLVARPRDAGELQQHVQGLMAPAAPAEEAEPAGPAA